MPSKINIIDAITAKTGMKQKDIAERIGVSRAQVSKWKAGEFISSDRRKALNDLVGLFGDDIEWSLLTKTPENAENWIKYISFYHNSDLEVDPCDKLSNDPEIWVPPMMTMFNEIGIKIPELAPDFDVETGPSFENYAQKNDNFETLLKDYLESYSALIRWCEINIDPINDDADFDLFTENIKLEGNLTDFALAYVNKDILNKLGADMAVVTKRHTEAKIEIARILKKIVHIMLSNDAPVMMDYFELINEHPYTLDDMQLRRSVFVNNEIESVLPYFERTVLLQNRLLLNYIGELHLKIDLLLKQEDRIDLSKILEHTNPLMNEVIQKRSHNKRKKDSESNDSKGDNFEEMNSKEKNISE